MCVLLCVYACVLLSVYVCVCCMLLCAYVCVCVCVFEREREREVVYHLNVRITRNFLGVGKTNDFVFVMYIRILRSTCMAPFQKIYPRNV